MSKRSLDLLKIFHYYFYFYFKPFMESYCFRIQRFIIPELVWNVTLFYHIQYPCHQYGFLHSAEYINIDDPYHIAKQLCQPQEPHSRTCCMLVCEQIGGQTLGQGGKTVQHCFPGTHCGSVAFAQFVPEKEMGCAFCLFS